FIPSHSQYNTHYIHYNPEKFKFRVPNFIGGLLPRVDQGNRGLYCMAMLTIFKPWRQVGDLINVQQNWESSFNQYSF
ncbi:hypothetical protein FA15DRAFT_558162, partial [Coprinopsis marcescibilis]